MQNEEMLTILNEYLYTRTSLKGIILSCVHQLFHKINAGNLQSSCWNWCCSAVCRC